MGSVLKALFSVTLTDFSFARIRSDCHLLVFHKKRINMSLDADVQAVADNGATFQNKLADTLRGLISQNNDRKSEIAALRGDHEELKKNHEAFVTSAERENDLRRNEIKSLEEKMLKENQARITDIAKLEGKLDTENSARKSEIAALDERTKSDNEARKTEIANLDNFAKSENSARKDEIANLNNFAKSENDGRKQDIADLNARVDKEISDRNSAESALNSRVDKEIIDREDAITEIKNRMDTEAADRGCEMDDLKRMLMRENLYLKSLAGKPLSVYFDAYRTKAYDGGGEENLTFNGTSVNVGGGMDPDTGIFNAPVGGNYLFVFHIATHDNKKALLSIRLNGEEVASVFDQNHKDNHKNSMAGTTIMLNLKKGDEVCVYAYTGTWLADFPMNHYTHWVGLLLKPRLEEEESCMKQAEEKVESGEMIL